MRSLFALLGLFALSTACADGTPLTVQSSPTSQYFIVGKGGTSEQPELLLKRVKRGESSYLRYRYDCATRTTRALGSADSLEALGDSRREGGLLPVAEGSIAYQLWKYACGK
jgi:hypothetical protein